MRRTSTGLGRAEAGPPALGPVDAVDRALARRLAVLVDARGRHFRPAFLALRDAERVEGAAENEVLAFLLAALLHELVDALQKLEEVAGDGVRVGGAVQRRQLLVLLSWL